MSFIEDATRSMFAGLEASRNPMNRIVIDSVAEATKHDKVVNEDAKTESMEKILLKIEAEEAKSTPSPRILDFLDRRLKAYESI